MNRLNVLLIESDLSTILLENAIKDAGFVCLKAHYNSTFLALVREITPDIIIFNLDTPSKELLADLQTLSHQSALPVIMFVNDDDIGAICAVTLFRFTGENGAAISSQNIFWTTH